MEEFRRELAGIESLETRRLFILVKTNHVIHRRIGEYVALITLADVTTQWRPRTVGELLGGQCRVRRNDAAPNA
jgi:hypothetical protein